MGPRARRLTPRAQIPALPASALAVLVLLLAGCGGSKPAFCAKASELKKSVQALGELNLSKQGVAGAEAAVRRVDSSAQALITAAKSEFPHETEAISSSAKAFAESVKAVSNPQTSASAIAQIPAEVAALSTATKDFAQAAKSKCE